jgi:hypothetical protein
MDAGAPLNYQVGIKYLDCFSAEVFVATWDAGNDKAAALRVMVELHRWAAWRQFSDGVEVSWWAVGFDAKGGLVFSRTDSKFGTLPI